MWKKVLFVTFGILMIVALATGAVASVNAADNQPAGTAQAPGWHTGGPGGFRGPGDSAMLDRVAQILGIDKQKLADAFKQAGTETAQKRMDDMFAKLVTSGKLTQAQADQYKAWLKAKPADVPGFGFGQGDPAKVNDMMSKLLTDGKITQAQYDAWKSWLAQKPNFDLPRPERPAGSPPSTKPQTN
jgi:hypothetical protein